MYIHHHQGQTCIQRMTHPKRLLPTNLSTSIIAGNDDLLIEILLFLPARSLVRFKVVSKRWRTLISAASFSRLHILHYRRRRPESQQSFILGCVPSHFFICHPSVKRLVPLGFPFPYVKILQSCNGLLLLECRSSPCFYNKRYLIFNPITKKSRDLYLHSACSGLYLMFDPSKSHHYKVVCFESNKISTSFRVYDSETHTWKDSEKSVQGLYKFRGGIYFRGCICFFPYRDKSFCYFPEDNIHRIQNPPTKRFSVGKNYIMESNGHLHFLWLSLKHMSIYSTYEMVDDRWLFSGDDYLPLSEFNSIKKMDLVGLIRGKRLKESMLLYHVPGKIMIYGFLDGISEVLVDFRSDYFYQEGCLQFRFKDAHPFVESLAPV